MSTGPANRVINYSRQGSRLGIASGRRNRERRLRFPDVLSAVGSLRREPCSVPGGGGAGRLRGVAARFRPPTGLRPHVPSADRADAEVMNSTGPWLGSGPQHLPGSGGSPVRASRPAAPAWPCLPGDHGRVHRQGPALPRRAGCSTAGGARAADDPAPGRGARAVSGRRQQGPPTGRRPSPTAQS